MAVFLLAVAIADKLRREPEFHISSVLVGYASFYFFQVVLVKLLALFDLLGSGAVIGVYLAAAVAGGLFLARSGFKVNLTAVPAESDQTSRLIVRITLISAAVVVTGLAVFSLTVPMHVWDVQAYHMPMVASYVQNEGISVGPTQDLRQVFRVHGAELQMLNLALLSRSDAWMELPNVLALIVSLAAVFAAARFVLRKDSLAYLAVILTLTAPQILYGSVTAKNDVVFLALILGAFYWTIRICADPHTRLGARVLVLALTCSLAVATKVMGLNVAGTAGLVLLILVLMRRVSFRGVVLFSAAILAGILALVGDVYWKNLNRSEMPIGIRPGEVHFTVGLSNLVEAAEFYVYDLSFRRLVIPQIFEHDFSHFGYFFPFLLVLGTVAALRQAFVKGERRAGLAVLALLTGILFASVILVRQPIQWDQRFMIWMVPAFAVLAAPLLRNWRPPALLALISFCSAICIINVALIYTNASDGMFNRSARHLVARGELPRLTDVRHEKYAHKIDGFEVLGSRAGARDSVLYVGAEDTWMYPAWGRRFTRYVSGVLDSSDVERKLRSGMYAFVVVESHADESLKRMADRTGARAGYAELYTSRNRSILSRRRLPERASSSE